MVNIIDGEDGSDDTLTGLDDSGNPDRIDGKGGNDTLYGLAGDDLLTGGQGDDYLDGGTGVDTAGFAAALTGVTVDLRLQTAQDTGQGMDAFIAVESLTGSDFDDLFISGIHYTTAGVLDGGNGNDRLYGYASGSILIGGAGDDYVAGREDITYSRYTTVSYARAVNGVTVDLRITGAQDTGEGMDRIVNIASLTGSAFDDVLTGTDINAYWGANAISGGDGNDRIYGYAGDDVLSGDLGDDYLDGGTNPIFDSDTVSFLHAANGITVDLRITAAQDTGEGMDTLVGFENIIGSAFDDVLTGIGEKYTSPVNVIRGGDGNDLLMGAYFLDGGNGDDILYGGGSGGAGIDTADFSYRTSKVTANMSRTESGLGYVSGRGYLLQGIENLTGSNYNDELTGNRFANALTGGRGKDDLYGRDGDDILHGGRNDDLLSGDEGDDYLDGDSGTDTVSFLSAKNAVTADLRIKTAQATGQGNDTIRHVENLVGGSYDDILTGNDGANTLSGYDGDDRLFGGGGDDIFEIDRDNDLLSGGDGSDTLSLASTYVSGSGFTIDLSLAVVETIYGSDTLVSVENVTGSSMSDTLTGDGGNNVLRGGYGDDVLSGAGGDDWLDGGAGLNRIDGGDGSDTLFFGDASGRIKFSLGIDGSQEGALVRNVENVTGTLYDDKITGNGVANRLEGGAGNDRLIGAGGADVLAGGAGDDLLLGGSGSDLLDGGAGMDTLSFAEARAAARADLRISAAQGTGEGNDRLVDIENLIGSAHSDRLTGNGVANQIEGGDGNDILTGNGGADILLGGAGDDRLSGGTGGDLIDGGDGMDTLVFTAAGQGIRTNLGRNGPQGTMEGNDILLNIENVTGSAFNDLITGNDGANVLEGGRGNDLLTGGAGADTFVFGPGSGSDRITDFSLAEGDRLDLTASHSGGATPPVITQAGNDVKIDLGDGSVITLTGVDSTDTGFMSYIIW